MNFFLLKKSKVGVKITEFFVFFSLLYSTRKYKVSESNSSYSVLLQYKFTLLYCVLLRGRSNGPHKEDWPDKRKRS